VLRVALYSLLFNLALVAAKLTLSLLSGSLALRADAIHSTVDVMASLALILGVKISERKSESFPLGLYKVENLASIAISFLCCFLPLMRSSWRRCEGMLCPSIIRDGCSMPWQR
jgi:divalent metal cation (Fe/Co/Zn/Cd) transporter